MYEHNKTWVRDSGQLLKAISRSSQNDFELMKARLLPSRLVAYKAFPKREKNPGLGLFLLSRFKEELGLES